MWKSCQEKTALPHTKCCGEVVVSVYVSWYVCESYVDRFAANFPFSKHFYFFAAPPNFLTMNSRVQEALCCHPEPPSGVRDLHLFFLSLGRFGFGFSFAPAFRICKQVTRHTHFRIVEHARATTI